MRFKKLNNYLDLNSAKFSSEHRRETHPTIQISVGLHVGDKPYEESTRKAMP